MHVRITTFPLTHIPPLLSLLPLSLPSLSFNICTICTTGMPMDGLAVVKQISMSPWVTLIGGWRRLASLPRKNR